MLVMLLSGLGALGNILLASSFFLQGTGFNEQFFYHMGSVETYLVAIGQFTKEVLGSICYVLVCLIVPALLPSTTNIGHPLRLKIVLLFACLIGYAPGVSYFYFLYSSFVLSNEESNVIILEQGHKVIEVQTLAKAPKNLILIYAESLEQLYFDQSLFGKLLPRLRKLKSESINFSNIHQVRGTGTTISGVISSQCGVPLTAKYNSINFIASTIENPFPNIICLGDVLKAYGYMTVNMAGSSNKFAGKDNFFKNHGYQELLGKAVLTLQLDDPEYQVAGWGLYDDSLLTFAEEKLDFLEQQNTPYLLTLTTMDTHGPNGHLSRSCANLKNNNSRMKQAFYCTDQLLGKFIDMVRDRKSFEDTLIVVISDHLTLQTSLSETLKRKQNQRRLTFFMLDAETSPVTLDNPGTHFDIAPTILSRLGIPGFNRFNLGQSLLDYDKGFWFAGGEKARIITNNKDLLGFNLSLEGDVTFIFHRPEIIIDGKRFIPNKPSLSGYEFSKIIFAVLFNDALEFDGFAIAENLKDLKGQVGNKVIVAMSSELTFNQMTKTRNKSAKYYYYIGKIDGPDQITDGLWQDKTISGSEIVSLLNKL